MIIEDDSGDGIKHGDQCNGYGDGFNSSSCGGIGDGNDSNNRGGGMGGVIYTLDVTLEVSYDS